MDNAPVDKALTVLIFFSQLLRFVLDVHSHIYEL